MNEKLLTQAEGVTQEIETGLTLDELWSRQAAIMEPLSGDDVLKQLTLTIDDYLKTSARLPLYVMLNCKETNYMTIFKRKNFSLNFASVIASFILNETDDLGGLKMFSTEDNDVMVQMYIGTKHYALFICDHLIVED